jgi:hypothetical protein
MTPSSNDSGGLGDLSVRVWFSRKLLRLAECLEGVRLDLKAIQAINCDEYYTFLDGPRYPR